MSKLLQVTIVVCVCLVLAVSVYNSVLRYHESRFEPASQPSEQSIVSERVEVRTPTTGLGWIRLVDLPSVDVPSSPSTMPVLWIDPNEYE